jgi:prefoldin subunit 5
MAADPTAKMQRIELNSLGVEQLSQLSKQLETELAFFTESMNELRTVASKFGRCQAALNSMKAEEKDKPALIPLSESVRH